MKVIRILILLEIQKQAFTEIKWERELNIKSMFVLKFSYQ